MARVRSEPDCMPDVAGPLMSPEEAARWMYGRLRRNGRFGQREAACYLVGIGDDRLAYVDHDGSPCVGRPVLARFRRFPGIVYDRRSKAWTFKERRIASGPGPQRLVQR